MTRLTLEPPPAVVVVDDDKASLAALVQDLEHRYDRDYRGCGAPTAEASLDILEELGGAGWRPSLPPRSSS